MAASESSSSVSLAGIDKQHALLYKSSPELDSRRATTELGRLRSANETLRGELNAAAQRAKHAAAARNDGELDKRQLQVQLQDERSERVKLQTRYEAYVEELQTEFLVALGDVRRELLVEVESVLEKYRKVAISALESAKRAKERATRIQTELQSKSEANCKKFEEACKEKVKTIIESYRFLTDKATEEAEHKVRLLESHCVELEQRALRQGEQIEKLANDAAQARVESLEDAYHALERENQKLKADYANSIESIKLEVSSELQRVENELISTCLQLLWSKQCEISEIDLRKRLALALTNESDS